MTDESMVVLIKELLRLVEDLEGAEPNEEVGVLSDMLYAVDQLSVGLTDRLEAGYNLLELLNEASK